MESRIRLPLDLAYDNLECVPQSILAGTLLYRRHPKGKVRYDIGEGDYDQSERWIQELLKEASAKP